VPAQNRRWCDRQAQATSWRQQPGYRGDDRSVGSAQPWLPGSALQHDQLLAQDEDLDLFGLVGDELQHIQLTNITKIR
jgi:hypothetical protein